MGWGLGDRAKILDFDGAHGRMGVRLPLGAEILQFAASTRGVVMLVRQPRRVVRLLCSNAACAPK